MQALLMAKIWFRNDNHAVWAVVMRIVNCTIITNVKFLHGTTYTAELAQFCPDVLSDPQITHIHLSKQQVQNPE